MTDTPLTCEFYGCERTENLHYAFGYGFAGYYCFEHCPNFYLGEGCSHPDEHEAYMTTGTPLTDAVTEAMRSPDTSAALSEMTRRLVAREQARQRRQARMRRAEHVISVAVDAVFNTLICAGFVFVLATSLAGLYADMGGQHFGRVFALSFIGFALLVLPWWWDSVRRP